MERYMPMIDNWIYFGHLDQFAILPSYPEQISDSMTSTFSAESALSRSAPVFTYSNSGPRRVSVEFDLHRDMMDAVNINVSNMNVLPIGDDYIDTLIRYLQACSVPKYSVYSSGAKAVEPPWVAIKFGNTVFIKGVINGDVSVTWKKPILANKKYAIANISFAVSEMDPYDAVSISQKGSFRGLTRTMQKGIKRG